MEGNQPRSVTQPMSASRLLKDALYEQVGRLAKSMANAKRLELVELLCQAPKSVETLANEAGISIKLASAHLKELRLAHVVETEKQGRQVIYRIGCPQVAGLLVNMRSLAVGRLHEMQHSLKKMSDATDVWTKTDATALWRKAKRGELTVIDVRPASEFGERHIPHARSIPLGDLTKRLGEIPKSRPVIAYCRGPFCSMSADAVKLLKNAGYEAYLWPQGAADWIAEDQTGDSMAVGS